ncbi:MAG: HAMP domain-containing protein [Actinobacteria bacterium]|nr:HAMP domain-containing protein [Actinomycetota bacterium]
MTRRLLVSYLAVTLVVLLMLEIPLAIVYSQRELERLTAGVERDATVIAAIYEDDLEAGRTLDTGPAERYTARTGGRVVVVDDRGISLIDTEQPAQRDLSTRPEIATALTGQRTSGRRSSETLGTDLLYVALPVESGTVVHGAVRVTLDTAHVDSHIGRFWFVLVQIAFAVLGVMAIVGWLLARSVTRPVRRLNDAALRFSSGDLSVVEQEEHGPPELRQLASTMAMMAQRLDAMLVEQRAFVADASHQLRTPLTGLRLRLENLESRLPAEEAAEVEASIDEIARLSSLVNDLLQLARADRISTSEVQDLAAIAIDRVDTWGAMAEASGVVLRLRGADAPAMVDAVPGAIEQILDNSFDNALRVSADGGEIVVTIERGPDVHRLTVADHGPGLSAADKERALHRFWRGDTSTPGTGLGLAIAVALARASKGDLELADAEGGGLAVIVRLPASNAIGR